MASDNSLRLLLLYCTMTSLVIFSCIYMQSKGNNISEFLFPSPKVVRCHIFSDEMCLALMEGQTFTDDLRAHCQEIQRPIMAIEENVNCSAFIEKQSYITEALSKEEQDFPLAYIITVHKEFETFAVLFRNIYMPQNIYCIHVDVKSSESFKESMQRLAGCFDNVFLASRSETVVYAGFSRLKADINCMQDLATRPTRWKYVLNLCGQDFPLRTNQEIVRILKNKWRGKNITPGIFQPPHMKWRTQYVYKEVVDNDKKQMIRTNVAKGPPPHGINLCFGTAYYAVTREFVQYVLDDKKAQDLLEWSQETFSPDEHYFVTLNSLPDAPGANTVPSWRGNTRAVKWRDGEKTHKGCKGHYVRDICVYGEGDLEWLTKRSDLFANKFEMQRYPLVLECLEHWLRQRTLNESEVRIQPSWRIP
ncbi:N-acetyllactosaminide beta-1,6-N-acetylglucosaminyl-transferase [Lethenteron reissneri]|uniref:N-acetyllactosaminide beta-1,6-N-acetylglucosaminyl-transferase n=1 Tax=Lethenteron reissneri TaxID=7753 RepID=UPI002AB72BE0|nr:N-acetyllactosaminide beta-1,6-N-acetylglucosaminyl-transferase [Lethenteron reissneri]XP_061410269.1 N-acetyllactosaminide beta-1,6-N-acetylglucosaminyl-transferase [Lethenteron reissneri]XP_061410270.1 N-acetyllactosaminide beta-1,6-N-acetylglucosaminyl-transferase [Lethenteron reissneri]